MDAFHFEQTRFRCAAARRREATDLVAGRKDAVAGNDDGNRILAKGLTGVLRLTGVAGDCRQFGEQI